MYTEIKKCRICGNENLEEVINLGIQSLTGVFPKTKTQEITTGPLVLVKCDDSTGCGLLQLKHSYKLDEMYGDNYGYRSGLNESMVEHLKSNITKISKKIKLNDGEVVVDIGSNDGTSLNHYDKKLIRVGIDPTAEKFKKYYDDRIIVIPKFFDSKTFSENLSGKKARVITSFSMFYDLENPLDFMYQVHESLENEGYWMFEQSYLPKMLTMNSYDTICHEHIEYYSLKQINWMCEKVGFNIEDVYFNDINGGSFTIIVQKSKLRKDGGIITNLLKEEEKFKLHNKKIYADFMKRILTEKIKLINYLQDQKKNKRKTAALGASTKGNVILQYCNVSEDLISYIGEVNTEKVGKLTPSSHIPIVSENDLLESDIKDFVILPWHFKNTFLRKKQLVNKNLIFPLANFEIIKL